jgi:hypothetical protein
MRTPLHLIPPRGPTRPHNLNIHAGMQIAIAGMQILRCLHDIARVAKCYRPSAVLNVAYARSGSEVLGLSPDTFRHWKHALPPLGGRNGYTPCFSPGDLLAMALIRTLTEDLGIRVGKLDELSTQLFEQCSEPWAILERSIPSDRTAQFAPDHLARFAPCRTQ